MRKLLAAAAVLAVFAMLCGCGGSSNHSEPTQQSPTENTHNEKPTATNIAAFWNRRNGHAPRVEVFTLNRGYWISNSATDVLTTTAKGVRLERAPDVQVYRIRARYAEQPESAPWDGEGLLPLAKWFTSISGKQHKLPLVEIKAYLDSKRLGEAVPIRLYCNGCDNRPRRSDPPRSKPYSG